ncbi:MAG: hypothetical protein II013_06070 [Lachnobacterium sp.]|nr:hypothetical protein [Lachnobacterium sp.]
MSLASITEKTLKLKPMGTGSTLLLNDDMIISYSNKKYNGTKVTEHSDDLLYGRLWDYCNYYGYCHCCGHNSINENYSY